MKKLAESGMTMLVVTHEMSFARDASTRVIYMCDGVILEQGAPNELFSNPQQPRTREFLRRMLDR
jgi:ABC-type histidine transport system ATPase subunit